MTRRPSSREWEATIVAERIAVDRDFQEVVARSDLSSHHWELVISAVTFDIVQDETTGCASLVPDVERLDGVIAHMVQTEPSWGGGNERPGFLARLRARLDARRKVSVRRAEAERLLEAYTEALSAKLAETGRWEMLVDEMATERAEE